MATSSLLGIDASHLPPTHSATGIDSLGPSDASDSGSDSAGAYSADNDSDTDRFGTGERASVDPTPPPDALDILPDHVESESAQGLREDDVDGDDPDTPQPAARSERLATVSADNLPESPDTDEDEGEDDGNIGSDAPERPAS